MISKVRISNLARTYLYHRKKLFEFLRGFLIDVVHDDQQSAFQMRGAAVELINGRGGTRGTEIIFMG